jgi:hypothetical protein
VDRSSLKIMPNESLRQFSKRIDENMREKVLHSINSSKSTNAKRKLFLKAREEKRKLRKNKKLEDEEYNNNNKEYLKTIKQQKPPAVARAVATAATAAAPRFGERNDRPPTLLPSTAPTIKNQSKSTVTTDQRQRAIDTYRLLKQQKIDKDRIRKESSQ